LFGWFASQDAIDQANGLFAKDNPNYSATADQINTIYNLGTVGADDWRYKQWFRLIKAANVSDRFYLQKYVVNSTPIENLHPMVMPALRLSEMYLIAAEANFDTDAAKALDYFNTLRIHRGIGTGLPAGIAKTDFIKELEGEYRKEFYGESQNFYMHKRLNLNVVTTSGFIYAPSDKIFVFPLPVDEQAYRN